MADTVFVTWDDDLRFRRVTWLFSLLESKAKVDTSPAKNPGDMGTLLGELFRAISECAPLANIPYWGAPIANIR